jgi:hypothetical protein
MSPVVLWLFFTLDRIISTIHIILGLSIAALVVFFLIWLIAGFSSSGDKYGNLNNEKFWEWSAAFNKHMRKWVVLAITLTSVTTVGSMLLPNTKEAVAIVVIPKVLEAAKNNKQLMQIPDRVLTMANAFMEKKIADWSVGLSSEAPKDTTSSKNNIDSQIVKAGEIVKDMRGMSKKVEEVLK